MTPGIHVEEWNGRDDQGQTVVSGLYFVRLEAGDQVMTRKAVLLK